jgi:hypothetical protein
MTEQGRTIFAIRSAAIRTAELIEALKIDTEEMPMRISSSFAGRPWR